MIKFKFRSIIIFLSILTLISYLTVFISPAVFWPFGLFNYLIPILLSVQFIFVIYLGLKKKYRKLAVFPIASILAGYYFIDNTYNFPKKNEIRDSDLSVLSFNAHFFRERRDYGKIDTAMINWAVNDDSEIKCFQEYSTNENWSAFHNTPKFSTRGYDSHVYSFKNETNDNGLAIFSKYPIVNNGLILLNKDNQNNCIYADIKVEDDTIRIYNFHLKSMGIKLSEFKKPDHFSENSKRTVTKLGSASSKRAVEIHEIIKNIEQCPYPYILTCDFNELVYGNNYYKLKKKANDTFEEVGSGFGFTFNSLLFFIRIDHQFSSDSIIPVDFRVIREMKKSDHFPLKGWYRLN